MIVIIYNDINNPVRVRRYRSKGCIMKRNSPPPKPGKPCSSGRRGYALGWYFLKTFLILSVVTFV
jgi:hypothetical protein